jgi:transposase-like protein/capsular polysaccharide biosynthesis protein
MIARVKIFEHEAALLPSSSDLRSASEDMRPRDFLREFLRVLWNRKGMFTTIIVVALLLASAAIVVVPPRYTAQAMIEINFKRDQAADDPRSEIAASLDAAALVNSAAQIIGSRANASAAVTRLHLDKDPAFTRQPTVRNLISGMRSRLGLDKATPLPLSPHELAVNTLMKHVTVTSETRSYVISIAATWDDSALAARLANTMALEYLRTQAMQQLTDARTAATRELAGVLSAYGLRHPNYARALTKVQDLNTRLAALRDALSIDEVGALGVGQSLIAADRVLTPSSPDPKLYVGLAVAAAFVGSILLAWRSRGTQAGVSTALFERYQHSERALVATLAEMYVQGGVSTRKVQAVREDPAGRPFSASAISTINKELDESLTSFARRPLHDRFAYLTLDARYEKLREAGSVVSKTVLIAAGIDWDGRPQMLGVEVADANSSSVWKDFLFDLKSRGLRGVEFAVSADHDGLVAAIGEAIPEAVWQRCRVRFLKDALQYLPRSHAGECLQELGWIYERSNLSEARADLTAWLAKWTPRYPRLSAWVDENVEQTLTFFRLPRSHHKHVNSTKLLERLNGEIRLRTDMVRIFPNPESCLRLIRAIAVEIHESWITADSCLDMDELREYKKLALRQAA